MKRCPSCNQTFDEPWLSFCTNDGTALIETPDARREPPPTIMGPPMPPSVSPMEQPTLNLPGSQSAPPPMSSGSGPFGQPPPYAPPQPLQPSWQPPPPPPYAAGMQQGLAIASMCIGIATVTIGWCCYLGVITGPTAIAMGGYQLTQINKDPERFGGKPFAIVGIVLGSVYFVFLALILLIYGAALFSQGFR